MDEQLLARLDERSKHMESKLDNLSDDVKEVLTLAKSTNGRVTKLEVWRAVLEGKGRLLWTLAGIVGVGIGYLVKHYLG